jgi:hypothetical protein
MPSARRRSHAPQLQSSFVVVSRLLRMTRDSSDLTADILRVLRSRLSTESILKARALREHMEELDPSLVDADDSVVVARVKAAVEVAIREHMAEYDDLREATQIIAGLSPRSRGSRIGRERIKELAAQALPRRRMGGEETLTTRRVEQIESSVIAPAVRDALQRSLGTAPPVKTRWRQCRMQYHLTAIKPDLIALRWHLEFISEQRTILLAVTSDPTIADGLCDRFPEITEVLVPSTGLELNSVFSVNVIDGDDEVEVPIVSATRADISDNLLAHLEELDIVEMAIARLPEAGRHLKVRIDSSQQISVREGYCYWTAPRHAELMDVDIDYAGFPNSDAYVFSLKPRVGVPARLFNGPDGKSFRMVINGWVTAGSGFELQWRRRDG